MSTRPDRRILQSTRRRVRRAAAGVRNRNEFLAMYGLLRFVRSLHQDSDTAVHVVPVRLADGAP